MCNFNIDKMSADVKHLLECLIDIGAHFVLLNPDTQTPEGVKRFRNGRWRGNGRWNQPDRRPTFEEVSSHIDAGGWLGCMPAPLNMICVDIDNKSSAARSTPRLMARDYPPDAVAISPGGSGYHCLYRSDYEHAHIKTRYDYRSDDYGIERADIVRNQNYFVMHPDSLPATLQQLLASASCKHPPKPAQLTFIDRAFSPNTPAVRPPSPPPAPPPAPTFATPPIDLDAQPPSDYIILTKYERKGADYVSWHDLPSYRVGTRQPALWRFTRRYAMRHLMKNLSWQIVYRIAQEGNRRFAVPLGAHPGDRKAETLRIADAVWRYLVLNREVVSGDKRWERTSYPHVQRYRRAIGIAKWRADKKRIKRDVRLARLMFMWGFSVRRAAEHEGVGRGVAQRVRAEVADTSKPSDIRRRAGLECPKPPPESPGFIAVSLCQFNHSRRAPVACLRCGQRVGDWLQRLLGRVLWDPG